MAPRKRRTRAHVIADLSVNYVERHALLCGFVVERVAHDYGIDLVLYTYDDNGEVENGQVLLQLKATDHLSILAAGETVAFRVERAALAAWMRELMPVFLIVYDAPREQAYWLYVQAYFEVLRHTTGFDLSRAGRTVTVHVPLAQVVEPAAIRTFARYRDAVLRQAREVVHYHE